MTRSQIAFAVGLRGGDFSTLKIMTNPCGAGFRRRFDRRPFSARACGERPGNAHAHARAVHVHARVSEVPDPGRHRRADVDDVRHGRANVRALRVNDGADGHDFR
jgi:hypothetical protein